MIKGLLSELIKEIGALLSRFALLLGWLTDGVMVGLFS
jgi:hypothetical protein